jgi:hypothetical protein
MGYTPPSLIVNKIAGGWELKSPSTTASDDLTIYPNNIDTVAQIKLYGNGGINLITLSGAEIILQDGGAEYLGISDDATDVKIVSKVADINLALSTTGTGKVKFGTYTAGAAVASTGYITILDAAGNTRKLMVQA